MWFSIVFLEINGLKSFLNSWQNNSKTCWGNEWLKGDFSNVYMVKKSMFFTRSRRKMVCSLPWVEWRVTVRHQSTHFLPHVTPASVLPSFLPHPSPYVSLPPSLPLFLSLSFTFFPVFIYAHLSIHTASQPARYPHTALPSQIPAPHFASHCQE